MSGNRIWVFTSVIVIAVVLVLGWFLGAAPLLAQAVAADGERAGVESQNDAQRARIVVMKDQYDRRVELAADLERLEPSVPGAQRLDDFYAELSRLAEKAGVTVTEVTTAEAVPYGQAASESASGPDAAPGQALGAGLEGRFFTIPVTVIVEGDLEDAMTFVDAAQTGDRLFLMSSVTYATDSTPTTVIGGTIFVVADPQGADRSGQAGDASEAPGP